MNVQLISQIFRAQTPGTLGVQWIQWTLLLLLPEEWRCLTFKCSPRNTVIGFIWANHILCRCQCSEFFSNDLFVWKRKPALIFEEGLRLGLLDQFLDEDGDHQYCELFNNCFLLRNKASKVENGVATSWKLLPLVANGKSSLYSPVLTSNKVTHKYRIPQLQVFTLLPSEECSPYRQHSIAAVHGTHMIPTW